MIYAQFSSLEIRSGIQFIFLVAPDYCSTRDDNLCIKLEFRSSRKINIREALARQSFSTRVFMDQLKVYEHLELNFFARFLASSPLQSRWIYTKSYGILFSSFIHHIFLCAVCCVKNNTLKGKRIVGERRWDTETHKKEFLRQFESIG